MAGAVNPSFRLLLVIALTLTACTSGTVTSFTPLKEAGAGPHVELHYLGNGGWIIRQATDVIATAPFVSNPNALTLLFPGGPDTKLIDAVIPAMHDVKTIVVGHGHYDHAMDLPYILATKAPEARLYGSTTVANTLAAVKALAGRLETIKDDKVARGDIPGDWVYSATAKIRFMPLKSTHAPHVAGWKLIPWWNVDEPQTKLPCCPYWWKEGQTYAYIIDFLDKQGEGGKTVFRIYYQDSAASPGTGVAPVFKEGDRAPVDVAILCVAAFDQVDGNPEHILTNLQPRHIIGGHWEDFIFQSYRDRPRPVPGTDPEAFHRRAKALAPERAIYLPEPGQKVYIPVVP